nr:hypothetical protein [Acidobacteriota bacterium]NIT09838.1 hypothetical protein [Acidobacteriota bacterium]
MAEVYQRALHRVRPLRASLVLFGVGFLALLVPLSEHAWIFLTTMLMALCLIVPAALAYQRDRFDPFEIIHVLGFRYWMYFGVGALWMVSDPYN